MAPKTNFLKTVYLNSFERIEFPTPPKDHFYYDYYYYFRHIMLTLHTMFIRFPLVMFPTFQNPLFNYKKNG